MSDPTGRSPRWMPATGGHSDRQLHAMEFIASSLDRIDDHLERIATSLAGSGSHKPFGGSGRSVACPGRGNIALGTADLSDSSRTRLSRNRKP